jgi:hypothetical protein
MFARALLIAAACLFCIGCGDSSSNTPAASNPSTSPSPGPSSTSLPGAEPEPDPALAGKSVDALLVDVAGDKAHRAPAVHELASRLKKESLNTKHEIMGYGEKLVTEKTPDLKKVQNLGKAIEAMISELEGPLRIDSLSILMSIQKDCPIPTRYGWSTWWSETGHKKFPTDGSAPILPPPPPATPPGVAPPATSPPVPSAPEK